MRIIRVLPCIAALATPWVATAAAAADVDVQGFIRQETAVKLNDDENPFNQSGNLFNGVTVGRDSSSRPFGFADTVTRGGTRGDNTFNLMATRVEVDTKVTFNEHLTGFAKMRGYFQPDVFEDTDRPSMFKTEFWGNRGTLLELSGDNYMIDLPALYVDYSDGPLWIRAGNQQIAWGESLFFRVLDVPNGLDLRRHLLLDVISEEFADERVASPGVRGSYRVNDSTEIEGFAQMFQPSILPPANTPYNLIPAQFVVHEKEGFDAVRNDVNFGGRIQTEVSNIGLQFIGVHRRNPDGVFQWRRSGVDRDIPGLPGSGGILADTPFEVSPLGVQSAEEWFTYSGMTRLNGMSALNSAVGNFPAAALLGANQVNTMGAAGAELDQFFQLSGGLRGHLDRTYPEENIFGLGANYIFEGEAGSLFDQLVVRGEYTVTPNKKFTNPSLGAPISATEHVASLNFEKYHRFTEDFPATFMVAQYLYKSESDLYGRHLSGMGGGVNGLPTGLDNFQAVAFAVQQPFPSLVWRADLAVLHDIRGGTLVQPALKWKPNSGWTLDIFTNVMFSDGGNDDIVSTVDWADEVGIRLSLQF